MLYSVIWVLKFHLLNKTTRVEVFLFQHDGERYRDTLGDGVVINALLDRGKNLASECVCHL